MAMLDAKRLAERMTPAGASGPGRTGAPTGAGYRKDVLQIFPEAEMATVGLPEAFTPLPYGFSVLDTVASGAAAACTSASSVLCSMPIGTTCHCSGRPMPIASRSSKVSTMKNP